MAIYSLNLKSIGKTTHAPGAAGAHIRYVGRDDAEPELLAEHMPLDPAAARTWLDHQEAADRKNARVIDKIRLALPRELTEVERAALVQEFATDLTQGRTPWYAAIHQTGKDAHNPHCHLVLRDRDIETGKRVVKLSDSARDRAKSGLTGSAADMVRERWELHANRALERAGHEVRIDRRSLEAQGIDREPTIHIGPRAQHIDTHVRRPESHPRTDGRGREIDYQLIDAGRTRRERQAEIIDLNLERDARSPDFATRERAKFTRDQMARDRVIEAKLIEEARRRTEKERRILAAHREQLAELREAREQETRLVREQLSNDAKRARQDLKMRQAAETLALKQRQSTLSARLLRVVDITGHTRRKHAEERRAQEASAREQRRDLRERLSETRRTQMEAVEARHRPVVEEQKAEADRVRAELRERNTEAERAADQQRQLRAAERSRSEAVFERALKSAEKARSLGVERGQEPGMG